MVSVQEIILLFIFMIKKCQVNNLMLDTELSLTKKSDLEADTGSKLTLKINNKH